ncbi:hypothetical protein AVEN_64186-1 [Araneus ventricosus]|uniref:Tc1-like transposase DDE domain-containing protein n=1 Tax=Araneus ventricosus TaxID=182803 RepID=A0A4Y2QEZ9_ARAVE|nr:hypothetical protein AVEN_64186-1 [Araneus ventricosus]
MRVEPCIVQRFPLLCPVLQSTPQISAKSFSALNLSKKLTVIIIGYGGCVEWPPRSPDLNPLDFFLWGYIKQRVYATPPPTLQELRSRITDACASVSPAMLYNVLREVQSRVQMCIVAEGNHFEHDR